MKSNPMRLVSVLARFASVLGLAFVLTSLSACAGNESTVCDPACSDFMDCCGGSCVSLAIDPNNCGGCGVVCPSGVCGGASCTPVAGVDSGPIGVDSGPITTDCRPECSSSQRCCGGTCANRSVTISTDGRSDGSFQNCGGCGIACDPDGASACSVPGGGGAMGMPRCLCGEFNACLAGEVCASGTAGWGCVSLSTDPNNCGAIGNECAEGETCSGGVCGCGGAACTAGQSCCGGTCTDTLANDAHCGACNTMCGDGESCSGGACLCGSGPTAEACAPAAGTALGESCCEGACVANDAASCGCGVMCAGEEMCLVNNGMNPLVTTPLCCGMEIDFVGAFCTGGFGG